MMNDDNKLDMGSTDLLNGQKPKKKSGGGFAMSVIPGQFIGNSNANKSGKNLA